MALGDAVRRAELGRLEQALDVLVLDVGLARADVASHPDAGALAPLLLLERAFADAADEPKPSQVRATARELERWTYRSMASSKSCEQRARVRLEP